MHRYAKQILFVITACLSFWSCEKSSLSDDKETPVFFVSGDLNGGFIHRSAGDNNLYMHTYTNLDSNQVKMYCGTLSSHNCPQADCSDALTFIFRDSVPNGNSFNFPVADYNYRSTVDTFLHSYKVVYQNQTEENSSDIYSYQWNFGDGNTSTDKNPVHYFDPAANQGWTNVCMTASWAGNSSTICADFSVNTEPLADFTSEFIGNPSVDPIGYPNFNISSTQWNLNDAGYTSSTPVLIHPSVFKLCVENTYSDGSVNRHCRNLLDTANGSLDGVANFYYTKEAQWSKDWNDFGKVVIQWASPSGTIYRSDNFAQPSFAKFKVLESTTYTEGNIQAQRINFEVSCRLYGNTEDDFVDFLNSTGYFALGK